MKKAHQIQEIGEFQELNDDVEYLLDALQVMLLFSSQLNTYFNKLKTIISQLLLKLIKSHRYRVVSSKQY